MRHITANTAQKDFGNVLDNVTRYKEPVTIVSDDNKVAVLLSMDEWSGIQETLYLQSIPDMVKSIRKASQPRKLISAFGSPSACAPQPNAKPGCRGRLYRLASLPIGAGIPL